MTQCESRILCLMCVWLFLSWFLAGKVDGRTIEFQSGEWCSGESDFGLGDGARQAIEKVIAGGWELPVGRCYETNNCRCGQELYWQRLDTRDEFIPSLLVVQTRTLTSLFQLFLPESYKFGDVTKRVISSFADGAKTATDRQMIGINAEGMEPSISDAFAKWDNLSETDLKDGLDRIEKYVELIKNEKRNLTNK